MWPRSSRPFRADSLDVAHLGRKVELSEHMDLVDEQEIDAHFLEGEDLVLALGARESLP